MSGTRYDAFVAVAPGLEGVLAAEIQHLLPKAKLRVLGGGVSTRMSREDLWTVVWHSRLGDSVRVRVGRFEARAFSHLEAGLKKVPFHAYRRREQPANVRVTCRKSALYHSDAVAERVRKALGLRGDVPDDAQGVWVRIVKDQVTLSVEVADRQHRRGWRTEHGEAPLRETLAAGLLRLAGAERKAVIWDPFCGSGTLPIEAALAAGGAPARAPDSVIAMESWPTHDAAALAAFRKGLAPWKLPTARFIGTDVDEAVVEMSRRNAARAGVEAACTFTVADFETAAADVPPGAALVTNLPYGHRIGTPAELRRTFERLGQLLSSRADLSPVVVLDGTRDGKFESATGLPWKTLAVLNNRGLPVAARELVRRS